MGRPGQNQRTVGLVRDHEAVVLGDDVAQSGQLLVPQQT
jgi:hypothetical protein